MVERARGMAFAAGATVFPGGRVDPGDHALGPASVDAAARVAAIRETIEEVGVAVGIVPVPDAETITALRAGLAAGQPFATLLARTGCALALDQLVPFARWRPNFRETRTFDTRFYLAESPSGAEAMADGGECLHAVWATAAAILAEADAGSRHLIFPTRRNLERLATFADFAEARAQARAIAPDCITPRIEHRAGEPWLCIPEGRGYPVTAERMANAKRG